MSYTPKTRLEKILMGRDITPRNGLEKAVKAALAGLYDATEASAASAAEPYDVDGTISQSEGTGTLTLDVDAQTLYEVCAAGRPIRMTIPMGSMTMKCVVFFAALELDTDGDKEYQFYVVTNTKYSATHLAADDDVVLTTE